MMRRITRGGSWWSRTTRSRRRRFAGHDILGGVQAEHAGAEAPDGFAAVGGADRLSTILDELQPVSACDLDEWRALRNTRQRCLPGPDRNRHDARLRVRPHGPANRSHGCPARPRSGGAVPGIADVQLHHRSGAQRGRRHFDGSSRGAPGLLGLSRPGTRTPALAAPPVRHWQLPLRLRASARRAAGAGEWCPTHRVGRRARSPRTPFR